MTDSSETAIQRLIIGLLEASIAAGLCLGIFAAWVLVVFGPVAEVATGTPDWNVVYLNETPWWGPLLQLVALAGAALTAFFIPLFASRATGDALSRKLGWKNGA